MIFAFGEFELDVRLCVLRRGSDAVRIQPKVFDTLRYLVEHRDRVVSKAELLQAVWNGQRLSGVAVPWSIRHARRALGQVAVGGPPIETVRGRGYRFAAEVRARPAPGGSPPPPVAPVRSRPTPEPFLGRESVMERLGQALAEAQAGRGSLSLLVGDSGIGKTRCANELADSARRFGVGVSIGRSTATEGAPAFWPWIQVLRGALEDPQVGGEERSGITTVLDRLVPQPVPGAASRPATAAVVDASRFWLSEAVARSLRHVARRRPRVLVIEDLHAADEGSVDVLSSLAPDLASSHLLVIATSREDVGGRFSRRLRPGEVIVLSGLGLADVERYLAGAIGRAATPDLARFVHERTAGNPLFLKEAARMVVAQRTKAGHTRSEAVALPEVARGFLHDRIGALGMNTREALDAASVIGERFELAVLKRTLDLPTETLLACLDDALRSRILERQPGDTYAFAHALLRDALYETLPTSQRLRLHGKVAAALQSHADLEPRFKAIAYHLHQALPDADADEVERYSRLAGDGAMQVCAYADAAELYRWAIAAHGHGTAPDVRATCELLMSAAYAERQSGKVHEAREYCGRAIEIARKMNFGDLLVKAARSLRPTVWLAPVPDRLVLDALEHALEILPDDADASRSQAYGLLANLPPHSSDVEHARDLSGRALEIARKLGDRSLVLEALVRTFPALTGPDTTDELLAAADEVLRLDSPLSWWSAEAFLARHHALVQRCDAAGARRALEAFGESAKLLRIAEAVWQYDRLCAQAAVNAGQFDLAEARFGDLFARSAGFRRYATFHYAAQMNALSWARTGKPLLASTTVLGSSTDVAWQWAAAIPAFRAERVMALALGGETASASAELDELARNGFRQVTRDMGYLYSLVRLAQASIALGHRETAEDLYASLRPYSGFNAVNGMSLGLGCVAYYLGLLARFLGRTSDAVAYLGEAVATNARIGDRVHEERARRELSELTGDSQQASDVDRR
jgi:DNA-binding winged helix-turn-helix (wHTH) protein/tetratricopeptide (TPR) repeat protein